MPSAELLFLRALAEWKLGQAWPSNTHVHQPSVSTHRDSPDGKEKLQIRFKPAYDLARDQQERERESKREQETDGESEKESHDRS